ncbi:MAG: hypothetical protein K2I47_02455 [Odoribacter sp.]|nr:hypothetical protein [Odoribacter sp.]
MGTLVYLFRGIAKHPQENKQLPTLSRVYRCVYTANASVRTAYPFLLKIGDFLNKDKAKRFKNNITNYGSSPCRNVTNLRKIFGINENAP